MLGGNVLVVEFVILYMVDQVIVYGILSKVWVDNDKVLLLFYQVSVSCYEYDLLIVWFNQFGYDMLVIDQCLGGELFGGYNQMVVVLGKFVDYLQVVLDFDFVFVWVCDCYYVIIVVVGSFYLLVLVILLVVCYLLGFIVIVSFLFGEYFDDKNLIKMVVVKVIVLFYIIIGLDEVVNVVEVLCNVYGDNIIYYQFKVGVYGVLILVKLWDLVGYVVNLQSFEQFLCGIGWQELLMIWMVFCVRWFMVV